MENRLQRPPAFKTSEYCLSKQHSVYLAISPQKLKAKLTAYTLLDCGVAFDQIPGGGVGIKYLGR